MYKLYKLPHILIVQLIMHLLLIFSPLALADLDASEPTGKEASVTEAGRRPVGRRRKGPRITEPGASTLLYFSQ